MRRITTRSAVALAILAVLAVTAVACGGKKSTSTTTTPAAVTSAPPTTTATSLPSFSGAEQEVATAWQTFFSGTTPAAAKIGLLENGQKFAATIKAQAESELAKSTEAKVTAVKITSPTTADVTYSILLGGQVALADQKGQAVKTNGAWMVGAKSFAALLALEGAAGSALPSPAASQ
jgi:hypothetical protein